MPSAVSERVVWIVDDSALDAERALRILAAECQVEVFSDGSAVLERLASTAQHPDVLVLDWVMPGVTGVEVCRFLRAGQGALSQIGILLLTTHRRTEQIVEGLSAGANDYLAKPYDDAELHARVHALLRTKQLRERAEDAEHLSSKLLQMAPDALIALDDARIIQAVNQSARELLQLNSAQGAGVALADVHPELDQRVQNAGLAETVTLRDIQVGHALFAPTLRRLPSGLQFHSILSLHDVTESRRVAARRLDFYSIIAHDLRSPLSTLTLRTKLILDGRHGELAEGLRVDMAKMDKNLESMASMINDFLDLARLDNDSYELHSERVDLKQLLADTMNDLLPMLEARQQSWVANDTGPALIHGDARRLQQVFTNLISNAVKFTAVGGTITTQIAVVGGELEVSVSDTGRGIANEKLATLFERYTRASDDVAGTGLGLLIVREIIEAHGGTVGVDSTVGVGSRFWFRLPSTSIVVPR